MEVVLETIRAWPDAFKATILTVGLALVLSALFAGRKVGPIEIPAFDGPMRWVAIGMGVVFIVLGTLAAIPSYPRAVVVVRPDEATSFRNEVVLVAENHSEIMAVPNKHIACTPTEGSWTTGSPPTTSEPLAPTFQAVEPFPDQLTKDVQRLRFQLQWNFNSDPIRLPLRGRLECVYAYRVNAAEFDAARFEVVYMETLESSGDFVIFNADRFADETTLEEFEALMPSVLAVGP